MSRVEDYEDGCLTFFSAPPTLLDLRLDMGQVLQEDALPPSLTSLALNYWDLIAGDGGGSRLVEQIAGLPALRVLDLSHTFLNCDLTPLIGSSLTQLILRGCTHPQLPAGLRALAVF